VNRVKICPNIANPIAIGALNSLLDIVRNRMCGVAIVVGVSAIGPQHNRAWFAYSGHGVNKSEVIAHPKFIALVPGARVIDYAAIGVSLGAYVNYRVVSQSLGAFIEPTAYVANIAQTKSPLFQAIYVGAIVESHVNRTRNVLAKMAVFSKDFFVFVSFFGHFFDLGQNFEYAIFFARIYAWYIVSLYAAGL
jgi:hypothetical protein